MSEEFTDGQPNGNRATVAMLDAKLDGLRELVRAEFSNTQRQLDTVSDLPIVIANLKAQNVNQEKRLLDIEHTITASAEWRRTHLPALVFAALSLIATIIFIGLQLH